MDHSQTSEDDRRVTQRDGGEDSVLEHALRTYEESERSLKSICQAVEEENRQLENERAILDDQQARLKKEHHRMKELVDDLRHERNRLDERQRLVDQQTNEFHQRCTFISLVEFEQISATLSFSSQQVQSALQAILTLAISNGDKFSSVTFPMLHCQLISLDNERRSTRDKTNHDDQIGLVSKRKYQTINPSNSLDSTDASSHERKDKFHKSSSRFSGHR